MTPTLLPGIYPPPPPLDKGTCVDKAFRILNSCHVFILLLVQKLLRAETFAGIAICMLFRENLCRESFCNGLFAKFYTREIFQIFVRNRLFFIICRIMLNVFFFIALIPI